MQYPSLLTPTTTEDIKLPSGRVVQIPKTEPLFKVWTGKPVNDTYGGKLVLSFNRKPAFAELAVLRIFQRDGWSGVWVDTYRNKYRTAWWPENEVELPPEQQQLLQRIYQQAGSKKGCWDMFCWQRDICLFAELKRRGEDRIRDTQRRWLEAAIKIGLSPISFLLVEWSVKPTRGTAA